MKEFDWDICEKTRNPRVFAYLQENFDKEVSEEKYLEEMALIQRVSHSKENDNRNHEKRKNRWSKSSLRNQYRRLQKNFGFFPTT